MKIFNLISFEFIHFIKNKSKFITYLVFIIACCYSIDNGFNLYNKHKLTIDEINKDQQKEIDNIFKIFDQGYNHPPDQPWIDLSNPYWLLNYVPVYAIKHPSSLLPLGLGQAEQYGFYKKIGNWSSTFDNDMVEEIANPERLVNGNIDFAFLIIFLLPVLLIILTYNIKVLEQEYKFDKLVIVQFGSVYKWVFFRLLFYVILLILTTSIFIFGVSYVSGGIIDNLNATISLVKISCLYILFFSLIFYFILIKSNTVTSSAFKMICVWLIFCVIIPAAVHQFASIKYPVNYMTEFLDVNRKEAYEIFELPVDSLYDRLVEIHPNLHNTKHGLSDEINNTIISNTVSSLINQMNKNVINKIESDCQRKNHLIESTYLFNPVSFIQNKWNYFTNTDFYSYQLYRAQVQQLIDQKLDLLTEECWEEKEVNKVIYLKYLFDFNISF
tara:strand:+ start:1466 stop:2788 length:1323 start_codon:yes stop_codon:yes gene_type:complete